MLKLEILVVRQFVDWNVSLCIAAWLYVLALDQNMKKLDNLQNYILQLESGDLEVGSSSYETPKSYNRNCF